MERGAWCREQGVITIHYAPRSNVEVILWCIYELCVYFQMSVCTHPGQAKA